MMRWRNIVQGELDRSWNRSLHTETANRVPLDTGEELTEGHTKTAADDCINGSYDPKCNHPTVLYENTAQGPDDKYARQQISAES
jgi:hypothetical protein